ncbi:hypothetical protein WR25_20692 [Diploscapter pachys]|uniref:ESCRT-I complex subunit MVB12A n=1 Tax=Diploscapter pachys TaxID=2018661 RepID=A0A2A2J519_9BILA|nr:hypothetical protein WR25_20692 [Diploscapter pachys]
MIFRNFRIFMIQAPISVITDMTIVKESDPIPHGFIALDYTADSREKSLRKRYICIKSEHRDRVVDAIGDVIVTSKCKKTPKDYTHAGEVDGLNIYFKAISIPPTYNLTHSSSASQINRNSSTLYPGLPTTSTANSVPSDMNAARVDVFTIKNPMIQKMKGVDGVPFKLNSQLEASLGKKQIDSLPPLANFDIRRLDSDEFAYSFTLEKATLAN